MEGLDHSIRNCLLGGRSGDHRRGGPTSLAVKYCLDVVAIRVQDECTVVPGVVRPLAWGAVVSAARTKGSSVKRPHCFAIGSLKRQVNPRDWSICFVYEQLVYAEIAGSLDEAARPPERRDDSAIKAFASLEIGDTQVNVINKPAKVKLHGGRVRGLTLRFSGSAIHRPCLLGLIVPLASEYNMGGFLRPYWPVSAELKNRAR